jgi:hemerythrin-like metal-binding protein
MGFEWEPSLAVGHEVIDAQHQELFKRVNTLLEACKAGRGKEEILGVMEFLEAYIGEHFRAEEQEMQAFQPLAETGNPTTKHL